MEQQPTNEFQEIEQERAMSKALVTGAMVDLYSQELGKLKEDEIPLTNYLIEELQRKYEKNTKK